MTVLLTSHFDLWLDRQEMNPIPHPNMGMTQQQIYEILTPYQQD